MARVIFKKGFRRQSAEDLFGRNPLHHNRRAGNLSGRKRQRPRANRHVGRGH